MSCSGLETNEHANILFRKLSQSYLYFQDTRVDLLNHTPQYKEAEELKDWINENLKDDPKTLDIVHERFDKVKQPIEETPIKLDELEKALQSSLESSKKFMDDTDDVEKMLNKLERGLDEQKPVSADKDTCTRQQNDHKYIVEEVKLQKPKVEDVLKQGKEMLENAEPGDEKDALEKKLNKLSDRWNDLNKKTNDRKELLDEVVDLANKVDDDEKEMLPWLDDVEKTMETLGCTSVDPDTLKKQKSDIEELWKDVEQKKSVVEHLKENRAPLVEKAQADQESVNEAAGDICRRYDDLEKRLREGKEKADKMTDGLDKFAKKRKPVEELCQKAKEALDKSESLGDDVGKAESTLDELKHLLDELNKHEPDVEDVKKTGDEIIAIENKPDNVTAVKQIVDKLDKDYVDLLDKLKEKIDETEKARDDIKDFKKKLEEVDGKMKPVDEKAKELEPVGATPEKVKEQLIELENLQAELQEANNLFSEAEGLGKQILDQNNNDPATKAKIDEQLKEKKKPLDELAELLNEREKKLKDQLQTCGAFQDQVDDFKRRIKNLEDRCDKQAVKPFSMNPVNMGAIKNNMDVSALKSFV